MKNSRIYTFGAMLIVLSCFILYQIDPYGRIITQQDQLVAKAFLITMGVFLTLMLVINDRPTKSYSFSKLFKK